MPSPQYFRSESFVALAPWFVATAACVLSLVLLTQFIHTLEDQMQRGQALRAGHSTPVMAQADAPDSLVEAPTQLAGLQP